MEKSFKALFLDISGVLYEGDYPISGAAKTVETARHNNLALRFVTNTASKSSNDIVAQLNKMHISIENSELFTAPIAAKHYIKNKQLRPFCLVHQAIKSDFDDLDQHNPNCVLLGDARDDLDYQSLNKAFQLCKEGAPLIGIGMNKYFKAGNDLNLDAGAFIQAIQWATDTQAIIMGKPSPEFFKQVVASTPFSADQCLMVGDDANCDVESAINAGLQACLVRTGKYQRGDEDSLPASALAINSIADLFKTELR